MNAALAPVESAILEATTIEQVLIGGDLAKLAPAQRVSYYRAVCESIGLNPLTKPFEYITLHEKLTLYAKRDCTDQLRQKHNISIEIVDRNQVGDVYCVRARATTPSGRTDESLGAVPTVGLKGDALANALMKAETKSKRRVTLSICGLGMLDETEIETIPTARVAPVERPRVTEPPRRPAVPEPMAPPDPAEAVFDGEAFEDHEPVISDAEARAVHKVAKDAGWTTDELKAWLARQYGYTSLRAIKPIHFDRILSDIQTGGRA